MACCRRSASLSCKSESASPPKKTGQEKDEKLDTPVKMSASSYISEINTACPDYRTLEEAHDAVGVLACEVVGVLLVIAEGGVDLMGCEKGHWAASYVAKVGLDDEPTPLTFVKEALEEGNTYEEDVTGDGGDERYGPGTISRKCLKNQARKERKYALLRARYHLPSPCDRGSRWKKSTPLNFDLALVQPPPLTDPPYILLANSFAATTCNKQCDKSAYLSKRDRNQRNLVDYLDEHFLQLTRNFKKRPTTLGIDPSTSLRTANLLRLTGDALGSIPGYRLGTTSVVWIFLTTWVKHGLPLKGQAWDLESAEGVDLALPVEIDTDVTRLPSLLLSGESALEEWLTNERGQVDEERGDDLEDVSGMLVRFEGHVSRNVVDPELEDMMD
ncbi:hypothetical protein BDZ97DRAFT_2061037 [Flammula alnicola]|nr:hypothetical protein BDZ97DRAFT_2061037 [Flammula alnicola]